MKPSWRLDVEDAADELVRSVVEAVEAELERIQDRQAIEIADALRTERDWWMARLEPLWDALDGRISSDDAVDRLRTAFGLSAAQLAELAAKGRVWEARSPVFTGRDGEGGT